MLQYLHGLVELLHCNYKYNKNKTRCRTRNNSFSIFWPRNCSSYIFASIGGASQGGLDGFLFGQAASLIESDVINLGILAAGCFVVLIIFFKEFKIATFDSAFGQSLGFPTKYLSALLTSVIVVAVVIGLHTVGVILMVSMLIAPAAAARQWISSLKSMIILSAIFGGLSGIIGSMISSTTEGMSTGPVIVITITVILGISLLFSPKQGYLFQYIRKRKQYQNNLNEITTISGESQIDKNF